MSTRFLPTRESVLDTWLTHFSAQITAAPGAYGLSPADALSIKTAVDAWHAAYLTAAAPVTRTRGTVATKRGEKKNVVGVVRGYAAKVRSNDAVSGELKIGLGLKLRNAKGSPVPAPASPPALSVRGFHPGFHVLRATDVDTRPGRGKPPGTAGLLVYRAVEEDVAGGPHSAEFLTLSTRVTFTSTFEHAQRGRTATYFARWINAKGETGPWSQGLSVPIAA